MAAGLDELEQWLFDLVRQGLAAARSQPYAYWDAAAARLVDAQLPGLAERVRAMGGAIHTRRDWAEHLLAAAGRWELAVRAWRRRDDLPDDAIGDLRALLGWPRRVEELDERVRDRWTVSGLCRADDGRLQSQRTWLHGRDTGHLVLVLDFAAAGASLQVAHVLGSVVEAEMGLYPGTEPRRAAFVGERAVVATAARIPGATTITQALDRVATWVAANPWTDRLPVALAGAVPEVLDGRLWLADGEHRLPVAPGYDPWLLLALSGGHPVELFGEWEDDELHPLAVAVDGRLVPV